MTENNMPAAEAAVVSDSDNELSSYEFAFHVLPTVAEGEVAEVYNDLKQLISKLDGEIFDEETPKRFDLAYEIVKHLEGKNRKFSSAYFGWIRFRLSSSHVEELTAEIDAHRQLLRYLIIRLTRVEEEHPFRFHDALETKKVTTIRDDVAEESTEVEDKEVIEGEDVETPEVKDSELEEAPKKDEA